MAVICIVALARGVPLSSLFQVGDNNSLSAWQALLFSVSLIFFGAYFGIFSTLSSAKFWDAPTYTRRLKVTGWMLFVGGIAISLIVLGELVGLVSR
jgi:hypothetical protein